MRPSVLISLIMPVPLELDALEMWGLKETYTGGK
jgi:hypothetical protein